MILHFKRHSLSARSIDPAPPRGPERGAPESRGCQKSPSPGRDAFVL
ncbi:hypothetical protein SS05631_c37370 [Sinorhizobium sp. CCBAU 05631]|nr:hypothetical protein SS05631_c37370 [Sinorhizobium sp. CCBAU 05631]